MDKTSGSGVINKERNEHIITLEDPIEYLHKHNRSIVNQREIGLDTDSYGNALRAALREDPEPHHYEIVRFRA